MAMYWLRELAMCAMIASGFAAVYRPLRLKTEKSQVRSSNLGSEMTAEV